MSDSFLPLGPRATCPNCGKRLTRLLPGQRLPFDELQRGIACLSCVDSLPARLRARLKFCPSCRLCKLLIAFQRDTSKSDSRTSYCRDCKNAMRRLSRHREPHKERTRKQSAALIRNGILIPTVCEECGEPRVQTHHTDPAYLDPRAVRWLCPKCHREEHRRLRQSNQQ